MKQRLYLIMVGIVFSLIFILQAMRLIVGWEAVIGGWEVPMWPSFIVATIAGYLAYNAFSLSRRVAQ